MTEQQRDQERLGKPYKKEEKAANLEAVITPGRAPAEGPDTDDYESPTHERWEEGTPERDPAEG